MILAGDVGGTKILLEAGEFRSGHWEPALARRYLIADFENISGVIEAFLDEMGSAGRRRIDAAAIGVAGAVRDNKVKMTNRAWIVDGDTVARSLDLPRVTVLNDLAAAAQGVDVLEAGDFVEIQPGTPAEAAPRVVLGVGTGLGVAYITGEGAVIPGEGGHVGFSPGSALQAELWKAMMATRPRVEAEDICSGLGLSNLYEFFQRRGDCPAGAPEGRADAAWIAEQAARERDTACLATLDLFAECLGNVAGDHALSVLAYGGVILAGGVVAKLAATFNRERFRAAFCAKGHFSSELMRMPVSLVSNERVALIGAARVATAR